MFARYGEAGRFPADAKTFHAEKISSAPSVIFRARPGAHGTSAPPANAPITEPTPIGTMSVRRSSRRKLPVFNADRRHQVEPQQREVGQVVAGERLALEVRVHQAQAPQTYLARAGTADVGQLELVRVAHNHRFDGTLTGEQDADLSVGLEGELGEVPRELGADDFVHRHMPAPGVLEVLEFAGLEPQHVS